MSDLNEKQWVYRWAVLDCPFIWFSSLATLRMTNAKIWMMVVSGLTGDDVFMYLVISFMKDIYLS